MLPTLITDISLNSLKRKIIIHTKYTPWAFHTHTYKEQKKIRSDHMYQLFPYLINQETDSTNTKYCERILFYPTITDDYEHTYWFNNHHKISVRSINLNKDWREIKEDLLRMI